jgi:hypothetical protein
MAPSAAAAATASAAAVALAFLPAGASASAWTHGWGSVGEMLWADFAGAGYQYTLTDEQVAFVANTYAIVSIEKCFAEANFTNTEDAVVATARRLKAVNDSVKVLMYYHVSQDFSDCYAAGRTVFNATPAWWLKDDSGALYGDPSRRVHDTTLQAVLDYYPASIVNATRLPGAYPGLLDGIFADGTGGTSFSNMNAARLSAVDEGQKVMMNMTRAAIQTAMGPTAQVIGNGLGLYPNDPPDHGVSFLPSLDGVVWEHFLAFEMLDPKNGSLIPTLFDESLQLIAEAVALDKTVLIKGWPGPATTPILPLGPAWPAGFPGGPVPDTYVGRAAAAAQYVEPALAGFLLAAAPSVWWSYSTWYTSPDGYFPCPATHECSTPDDFYPTFANALGSPAGPAQRVPGGSGWVYTRAFEHATVTFDAVNWLNGSSVTWG